MTSGKAICVFCASSARVDPSYFDLARDVSAYLAKKGFDIVYGGAQDGLMGAVADTALEAGAKVTGVIPKVLEGQERAHKSLSELIVTKDLHERQRVMANLSDGFLILPGGLGTLAEFFEILTWKQIGIHNKPIVVFNHQKYWDPLLFMMNEMENQSFFHKTSGNLFVVCEKVEIIDENFSFS